MFSVDSVSCGKLAVAIWEGDMMGLFARRRARYALEVAVVGLLLGEAELEQALKERYKDKWDGFIDDIINGTKPYDEAVNLVTIFLLDILGQTTTPEAATQIADAINERRFDSRPHLIDVISQIGYFTYLAENDGDATKGASGLFLREIAKWFADDVARQERVRQYLAESVVNFRQQAHAAMRERKSGQVST